MKKHLLKVLFITQMLCTAAYAQKFKVDTISWGGNNVNRINIVILGDGYTSGEQTKFLTDANTFKTQLFATSPYKEYKNYINLFAVEVISNQSGATHAGKSSDGKCGSQPIQTVDNYFGSAFDASIAGGGYHRLLVSTKTSAITNVLANNTPNYHQALILVNTSYYGGAGGNFATASTHSSSGEICIHEVGHSFARLADEYWAGSVYASEKANMTANSNTSTIKWKQWVGTGGVGAYPYNGGAGWYKPVNGTCKMEYLGTSYPFCAVCKETHIMKFLDLAKPYDSFTPANTSTINSTGNVTFDIKTVLPSPNTLKIVWTVNGVKINNKTATLTLSQTQLNAGVDNAIQATIIDTTSLLRAASHITTHTYSINWTLKGNIATGLDVSTIENDFVYRIYPNPIESNSVVEISKESADKGTVKLEVYDTKGQLVSNIENTGKEPFAIGSWLSNKPTGVYMLRIFQNDVLVGDEKLVK
jgi:hypothetical protein